MCSACFENKYHILVFTHIFHLELLLSQPENLFPKGINYTIHFFHHTAPGGNENGAESIFQQQFRPQN